MPLLDQTSNMSQLSPTQIKKLEILMAPSMIESAVRDVIKENLSMITKAKKNIEDEYVGMKKIGKSLPERRAYWKSKERVFETVDRQTKRYSTVLIDLKIRPLGEWLWQHDLPKLRTEGLRSVLRVTFETAYYWPE